MPKKGIRKLFSHTGGRNRHTGKQNNWPSHISVTDVAVKECFVLSGLGVTAGFCKQNPLDNELRIWHKAWLFEKRAQAGKTVDGDFASQPKNSPLATFDSLDLQVYKSNRLTANTNYGPSWESLHPRALSKYFPSCLDLPSNHTCNKTLIIGIEIKLLDQVTESPLITVMKSAVIDQ